MNSETQKILSDLQEENTSLNETKKRLLEEQKKLEHKVKLMDIYNTNHIKMKNLLKNQIEEQKAINRHLIEEMGRLPFFREKIILGGEGESSQSNKDKHGSS